MNSVLTTAVPEGLFAAVVRALITVGLAVIPGAGTWWDTSEWRNAVTFGLCLVVAITAWAVVCPLGWLEIPGYAPACDVGGALMSLYAGFIAFLFNYVGEDAFRWVRKRRQSQRATGMLWLWVAVILIAFEGVVLFLGVPLAVAAMIALLVGGVIAVTGIFSPPVSQLRLRPNLSSILWWVIFIVKIASAFLPLPFMQGLALSVAFNVILFILANLV